MGILVSVIAICLGLFIAAPDRMHPKKARWRMHPDGDSRRAPIALEGWEMSSMESADDSKPSTDEELAIAIGRLFL
jgi:hypothetical protein